MIKQRGLMCLAVAGNIATSWSWFGVNMLGVGLHSYGFTDAAFWRSRSSRSASSRSSEAPRRFRDYTRVPTRPILDAARPPPRPHRARPRTCAELRRTAPRRQPAAGKTMRT
jgi:hypothetical protein